jgi:hypothetical protein
MEYILVERGSAKPHDLTEVLIDIPEFSRWTSYHSDTIRALERKGLIQRIPGKGFIADYLFSYLLASTANEVHRNRIKAWKNYLQSGEAIPDQLYVESESERFQREAEELERNKSPFTRLQESQIRLDEASSRVRSERRNVESWRLEIGKLTDWIQRSESALLDLEQREQSAIAVRDEAERVYQESRKPFQQVDSSEEVAPIVVSEEDRLDISHKKRTSNR